MNIPRSLKSTVPLMALAILLCGCASVGKEYNYRRVTSLELGKTRSSDYQTIFGKPEAVEEKQTADGKFEFARYAYAFADMGTARVRILFLEFRDGTLNSYLYMSTFDEDKTSVKTSQLQRVERGSSKMSEVRRILGKPQGMARCPSHSADFKDWCEKGAEVWLWAAMEKVPTFGAAGSRPQKQEISVVFDNDGVVTEVGSRQGNL